MPVINNTLNANAGQGAAIRGNFLFLEASTGRLRLIAFDAAGSQEAIEMRAGDRWELPRGFVAVRIEDVSGSANDFTLFYGVGSFNRATVSGSVSISQGGTVSSTAKTAAAAAAVIAAADSARRSLTIQNIDAANTARIGPAGVTAASGLRLQPGEAFTADAAAAAAWYAIREGAADVSLIVLEEKD